MIKTEKELLIEFTDKNSEVLIEIAKFIHSNPELGNQEFLSGKALGSFLKKHNFTVTHNIAGHETGFTARKVSSKPGPKIAFLAEYDALPEIGHGCGHNLIGTASAGAAAAIGNIIESLGGEVVVFGTPAEEGGDNGSAKASFVNEGLFDNIDAALMFHPANKNSVTQKTQTVEPVDIEFFGKTAHAAGSPEKGINALHALIHFYNTLHSHQTGKFKNLNIHGVITDGGKAPNVIPDYAKARFYIRGATSNESREAVNTIKDILTGIDKAFNTTSKLTYFQNRVDHFVLTPEFDKLFSNIYEDYTGLTIEKGQIKPGGSTDAANVSHVTPVIHPYLSIGDSSLTGHTTEFADAACSEKGFETLLLAAKLLSLTALELYKDSELLGKIKNNWNRSINSQK